MTEFQQYQRVRIKAISSDFSRSGLFPGMRVPCIGDIATIVEVYSKPPGYELECVNQQSGETDWLASVTRDEVELEAVDAG